MSARGPIEVQLAKAQDSVPPKSALVGGTIWELKYDGYRAPLRVTGQGAELWSRNGSNLSSHFPDLVAAAEAQLAAGVVLDGEAVVWLDGRLNFDQLQRRMVSRPAVAAKLAREHPASYVAFDLLTLGEQDLRPHPWRDRRAALEDLASTWRPPLQLSPYTDDYDTALEWLVDYRVAGVEGLVAKGAGSPYRPGSRDWIKVRSRENLDVIVGAVIGPASRSEAVVAGRYTDTGELVIVGRTTALSTRQAKQLATVLTRPPPVNIHGLPASAPDISTAARSTSPVSSRTSSSKWPPTAPSKPAGTGTRCASCGSAPTWPPTTSIRSLGDRRETTGTGGDSAVHRAPPTRPLPSDLHHR